MSSPWLAFVSLVMRTGVESADHITKEHYKVWRRLRDLGYDKDLLTVIARFTPERAVAADMFAIDIDTLRYIANFDFLLADHFEVFFNLDQRELDLSSLGLISQLNAEQIFVCRVFGFRTLDSIISLLDISIDDNYVEAFSSLSRVERRPSIMRYILSLDRDYIEAFVSLPESERDVDTLFEIGLLERRVIQCFNQLSLRDSTYENLVLVQKLTRDRGELFYSLPYYEKDIDTLKMIVDLDDRHVRVFLSLPGFERCVVSLDLIKDLSDDAIDVFCSIEAVDQDRATLAKVSRFNSRAG